VDWNWQGKSLRTRGKTCPSATLSTTNPIWTEPGSNPGLRGGRPAANRLSHGTAWLIGQLVLIHHPASSFISISLLLSSPVLSAFLSHAGYQLFLSSFLPPFLLRPPWR
jgi:hypothetical protein